MQTNKTTDQPYTLQAHVFSHHIIVYCIVRLESKCTIALVYISLIISRKQSMMNRSSINVLFFCALNQTVNIQPAVVINCTTACHDGIVANAIYMLNRYKQCSFVTKPALIIKPFLIPFSYIPCGSNDLSTVEQMSCIFGDVFCFDPIFLVVCKLHHRIM